MGCNLLLEEKDSVIDLSSFNCGGEATTTNALVQLFRFAISKSKWAKVVDNTIVDSVDPSVGRGLELQRLSLRPDIVRDEIEGGSQNLKAMMMTSVK